MGLAHYRAALAGAMSRAPCHAFFEQLIGPLRGFEHGIHAIFAVS
jgi:hypothetical protein